MTIRLTTFPLPVPRLQAGRPFDDYFTLSVLAEMPVLIKAMKKHRIL